MSAPLTPPELLADFARRGFALRAVSGQLSVSPATALTDSDRTVIRERRTELLAALSPAESWDAALASRLMFDADTQVEQLGVDGRHPTIANAVAMVASALAMRDMETFRFALSEFAVRVREVSREQFLAGEKGKTVVAKGANVLPLVGHA